MTSKVEIQRIADLLAEGYTIDMINEEFEQDEQDRLDSLAADYEDDSDEGIARRYMISADDTRDSRGELLRPSVNEAGEPWWM